jgi:hypothetical protein
MLNICLRVCVRVVTCLAENEREASGGERRKKLSPMKRSLYTAINALISLMMMMIREGEEKMRFEKLTLRWRSRVVGRKVKF